MISRSFLLALTFVFLTNATQAQAAVTHELECLVDRKLDTHKEYTRKQIDEMRWSVIIRHHDYHEEYITVSRCDSKAPCDEYRVDHVEFSGDVNISKYYYFLGQFDVQVFHDGSFIENNGRGSLAFGQCNVR